ncbi:MAG: hypothetical protein ACRD03_16630 [Acidimicrobiales bacterium]
MRLDAATRPLRRILRPIEWVVLEDVALDATADQSGVLAAHTSARAVAEHLGITPGAAAKALARPRAEGLVHLSRQPGEAGRFGLSVYELGAVPGLAVIAGEAVYSSAPPAEQPRLAKPHTAIAHRAQPRPATPRPASPRSAERHMAEDETVESNQQLDLLHMELPVPRRRS